MLRLKIIISFIIGIGNISFGQNQIDTIPFTLTKYNNILVPAMINQVDSVDLMFHTGAAEVFVIEKSVERMASIKFDNEASIKNNVILSLQRWSDF